MTVTTVLKSVLKDRNWFDPANWSKGVPTAGVLAEIDGARTADLSLAGSHPANVGELEIAQSTVALLGGQLTFAPPLSATGTTYDLVLTKSASLTVAATAALAGTETIGIGLDGAAAKMTVLGTVSENFANVADGVLAISGTGHWIAGASGIAVGGANGASLNITSGGVVDEGRNGLGELYNSLSIGEGLGSGAVRVYGSGSLAAFTTVWVGANGEGTLNIANGGVVEDRVGVVALNGDGYVTVTGEGSRWDNFGGLTLGDVYPTNSTLTVTNYGQVDWGGVFQLNDTLKLDGSAVLGGAAILDGGEIEALGGHGYVELQQHIGINANWLFQFQDVADFSTQANTALLLDGQITGSANSEVRIASGDVVINDAGNSYGFTEIYGGILEVGATGALGTGEVEFSGGAKTHAELFLDGASQLSNVIVGFGATDKIGLTGLHLLPTTTKTWTENSTGTGGTLTLASGNAIYALNFQGAFNSASQFRLDANGVSGATVSLASPA